MVVVALITFLVFSVGLFNSFVWDDEEQILANTPAHSIGNVAQFFTGSTFNPAGATSFGGNYYKPIMTSTFALLYTLFGPTAFFFHLLQLLLHMVNGIMVFLLLRWLLGEKKNGSTFSFFGALVFGVHPLQVEAVVYASALQDVLFFCFGMLALLVITRAGELSTKTAGAVGGLLLLSILSKETGIVFAGIVLLYCFHFARRRLGLILMSVGVVGVVYGLLRFVIAGVGLNKSLGFAPIARAPLSVRLLTAPKAVVYYLQNLVYPDRLSIGQHWLVTRATLGDFWVPFAVITSLLVLFLGIYRYRLKDHTDKKLFLFFLCWVVGGIMVHIHLVPLDMTVADRWFYFPMAGVVGMIAVVLSNITISIRSLVIGSWVVVVVLSVRSAVRVSNWKNGLTLYAHDVVLSSNPFDIENNLGVELWRAGEYTQAHAHFVRSTRLGPHWWTNWNNLGASYEKRGDSAKAEQYYKKAIENGVYYLAYENYARILVKQGKLPEARAFLEETGLRTFPQNPRMLYIYEYVLSNEKNR